MSRRALIATASLVALIGAVGGQEPDRALAEDAHSTGMHVISSDVTARYVPLGLNKAVAIEMPADIKDVLVSNPAIVTAVVQTKRLVYIIGIGGGQTNVFLFDARGRQIGALDIAVAPIPQMDPPPILENSALPGKVIMVYRGADDLRVYRCTPTCSFAPKPKDPDDKNSSSTPTTNTTVRDTDANGMINNIRTINSTTR